MKTFLAKKRNTMTRDASPSPDIGDSASVHDMIGSASETTPSPQTSTSPVGPGGDSVPTRPARSHTTSPANATEPIDSARLRSASANPRLSAISRRGDDPAGVSSSESSSASPSESSAPSPGAALPGPGSSAGTAAGGSGSGPNAASTTYGPQISSLLYHLPREEYIFSEPNSPSNIIWSNEPYSREELPPIRGATLTKLVEFITPDVYTQNNSIFQFLLTYRTFASPSQLLELLVARYDIPKLPPDVSIDVAQFNKDSDSVRARVINVLKTWVEKFFFDFQHNDQSLIQDLLRFCDTISTRDSAHAERMRKLITRKSTEHPPTTILTQLARGELPPLADGVVPGQAWNPLLFDHMEVARQMTRIEFETYRAILTSELSNQAWTRGTRDDKLLNSPNIVALIERFNMVSSWVATTIVFEEDLSKRRDLYIFFIRLAKAFYHLNNFNGVMEVISGISSASVFRLYRTRSLIGRQAMAEFVDLSNLISTECNSLAMRNWLKQVQPPVLPYLGMYLTDLMFTDSGNPDFLPGTRLINYHKCRLVSAVIQDVQQYQQTPYNLPAVEPLASLVLNLHTRSEDDCYKQSLKIEPRSESPSRGRGDRSPMEEFFLLDDPANPFLENDMSDVNIRLGGFDFFRKRPILQAASVAKLVEYLTHDGYADTGQLQVFLLTYRMFVCPRQLLSLLAIRFTAPKQRAGVSDLTIQSFTNTYLIPIQLRVIMFLRAWITKYFNDFARDPALLAQLSQAFMTYDAQRDPLLLPPIKRALSQLRIAFRRRLQEVLDGRTDFSVNRRETPRARPTSTIPRAYPHLNAFCPERFSLKNMPEPQDLAFQFASLHEAMFLDVDFSNLIKLRATPGSVSDAPAVKSPPSTGSASDFSSSYGELFTEPMLRLHVHSERIYAWAVDRIMTAPDLASRIDQLSYLIDVAEQSRRLHDYATMCPLVAAFRSVHVRSLRRLWQNYPYKDRMVVLQELTRLFSNREGEQQFVYMQAIRRSPLAATVPFMQPFLDGIAACLSSGIYVSDKKLVDFDKCRHVADIIQDLMSFRRNTCYTVARNSDIQDYILQLPVDAELLAALTTQPVRSETIAFFANRANDLDEHTMKAYHERILSESVDAQGFISMPKKPAGEPAPMAGSAAPIHGSKPGRECICSADPHGSGVPFLAARLLAQKPTDEVKLLASRQLLAQEPFRQQVFDASVRTVLATLDGSIKGDGTPEASVAVAARAPVSQLVAAGPLSLADPGAAREAAASLPLLDSGAGSFVTGNEVVARVPSVGGMVLDKVLTDGLASDVLRSALPDGAC